MEKIRNNKLLLLLAIAAFVAVCYNLQKRVAKINDTDYEEVKQIIRLAYTPTDSIDFKSHERFWEIIDKYGGNPKYIDKLGDKQEEFDNIAEFLPYQYAFYEDARISLKQGKPYESEKRKQLGEMLPVKILKEEENLMLKIASRQPVPVRDTLVILNEQAINNVLQNLDSLMMAARKKLDILYDRDYFTAVKLLNKK